ncbi:ATP-dependent DNA ligase [Eubacterium sp.]
MEKVIKIFKDIQSTSSLNDKKAIIAANKDNELFKKCLRFLCDSNIITGLSAKKVTKNVKKSEYILPTFEDVMQYLQNHNTGTDDDISMVQTFIDEQSEEYQDFYEQMVTKKFRLGCDKKVVNSVIPKLIPTWEVQQAYPISEKNEPKDGEWFALSQKLNGNNCAYYKGQLISRQGKPFTGLDHIIKDIEQLPKHENYMFNGELIRKNYDNLSDNDNFQIGTGIINSDESDKSCIKFVIYECIPNEEFENGESKLKYKARREQVLNPLTTAISRLQTDNLEVVSTIYEGTDKSVIQPLLDKADKDGWEGLMLNKDTKWKNKRNNGILKVKSFKHADIRCTKIIEGDGKYKGTLGLIKCDYKGYELGVGSGFTDEQRNYYWNNPDKIIGRIVQIKFKGETKNKNGGISVQFPIFEIIRNDKSEPSYN